MNFEVPKCYLKKSGSGGRRCMPYVFTEQGITMLSAVLKNDVATNVSENIMRAFVEMRKIFFQTKKCLLFLIELSINN